MRRCICDITVGADQVTAAYAGQITHIQARSHDGLQVRFPWRWLRPFVGHDGIRGRFEFVLDDQQRLLSLVRADAPSRPIVTPRSGAQRSWQG